MFKGGGFQGMTEINGERQCLFWSPGGEYGVGTLKYA